MSSPAQLMHPHHLSSRAALALALFCACGTALAQDVTNPGDAITPSSGNHPAGEPPSAAIDNSGASKYLNFDRFNTGFTVIPTGTGIVRTLGIVTANDAPERDPTTYILEGSNDGATFTIIAQGALNPPTQRFAFDSISFFNDTAYAQYRVTFPTIRGNGNSMQVGEVQLLTAADILTPGDPFVITYTAGAFSNANEGAANLFDNRGGTKLDVLNGNLGPTFVDITPGVGASTVNAIDVFGGNDDATFGGRSPTYVTLYGSNDGGVTFTQIFTTPIVQVTRNYEDQQFGFANTTTYTSYRVEFGPAQNSADMQIGEIQLLGTASATPPSNDSCATARIISAGATSGANFNATGTDITACGTGDTADVWFSYLAPISGLIEANTFGAGTIDTTLAVFDGCGGPVLDCSDNARGGQARIRWTAVAGRSYKLRVAGAAGATGTFTLNVDQAPVSPSDTFITLNYNFNGMVHQGEAGNPDRPQGYRSLSDRGLRLTGAPGSIEVGLESNSSIPYQIVTQADQLDMVHLGNRNTTDGGNWAFDTIPGNPESENGTLNRIGVQPDWLTDLDQRVPQITDIASLGLAMTPDTRIGVIFQASNGGTNLSFTVTFTNGVTGLVTIACPDWFGDQNPPAAGFGVEVQQQLGTYFGTGQVDLASPSVDLNVTEAIVSTASLRDAGVGDFTGLVIRSFTFSDSFSLAAGTGILAVTVRDADVVPTCRPDFNGDGTLDPDDLADYITAFFSVPASPTADFNGDGTVDPDDLADYITAFFTGCA